MNILVIGGSGFIGTRLVDELLAAGHSVRIFDIIRSKKYPELTVVGDVRSVEELVSASQEIDLIYNLAAEHRDDVTPLSLYHEVNVEGAENIVYSAKENGIQNIIFTSSVAIYGLNKHYPDESFPAEPFNEYGRTKWEAEKIFKQWAAQDKNRSLAIVRPAVVFGEGNRGNVYNLISQIKSGRFLMIGDGKNRKSMGYVGNIAHFLSILTEKNGIQIFNFCDKPDLSSSEIASIIAKKLGVDIPSIRLPLWLGLATAGILDIVAQLTGRKFPISSIRIRKFAAETTISTESLSKSGYQPKYSLEEGLSRMISRDFNKESQ